MERYKVAAARRMPKDHQTVKFCHAVDMTKRCEPRIRARYHRYLNFNSETLAWMMMAVDASFLLEFLRIYATKEGEELPRVPSSMPRLFYCAGTKSTHNAILRDVVMLENQIPLFLWRNILELQFSSLELADELLISTLMVFTKELSPFNTKEESSCIQVAKSPHLLDVLYHVIVPRCEEPPAMPEIEELSEANEGDDKEHTNTTESKPSRTFLSNFRAIRMLKQSFQNLFSSKDKLKKEEDGNSTNPDNTIVKPPLVEEITIPSVTELSKAGVRFIPTNSGITSISFEIKSATFYLPTVRLDVNSEVVLRNLVAYEACKTSGPLVLARYTELMNGIIDTQEDAKLLREKGIILSHLKRDEEVANLWNGMNRSLKLTKVEFLDKTIADVNKYYNSRWKVKVKKFFKHYVFRSWKFLTFLATLLMVLFMGLQSFCSVYSCPRIFYKIQYYRQ